MQGGQFGHGFLAAGISKAVMGRFSYADGSAEAVLGRTAIAATVGGTISEVTGGKFANGAMTAAFATLVTSAAQRANTPDFSEMSDQELADWIHENATEFGIETPEELRVLAIDEYRQFDKAFGWIICSDALCDGRFDAAIYGHYDKDANVIELFKPSFEAGFHAFSLSPDSIVGYDLSRPAIAVQSFGHEAAHSMGIDINRGIAPTHYNAERVGLDAMKRFRRMYE